MSQKLATDWGVETLAIEQPIVPGVAGHTNVEIALHGCGWLVESSHCTSSQRESFSSGAKGTARDATVCCIVDNGAAIGESRVILQSICRTMECEGAVRT